MPRPAKRNPLVEGAEKAAAVLAGFDYNIHAEDFVLYELHRLIEEDRASFDDAEFRNLIDEGIRAHIEEHLEIRARLAEFLREAPLRGEAHTVGMRVVRALEDIQADLCNVAILVRSYTAYLLSRLQTVDVDAPNEKITTAADLLFESTGDRSAAETALSVLCNTASPVSARVLAHAVSEPLLEEDLEAQAFSALKRYWPLPRHYMIYNLREHPHEDIPVRWFQLFVEVDEATTVDLVLEELRAHGDSARHQEDLGALIDILQGCRDPEIEDKVLDAVNSTTTDSVVLPLLRKFLEEHRPLESATPNAWTRRAHALEVNRQYVDAAAAFDKGEREKSLFRLNKILEADPNYPFAVMLKRLLEKS
jgi:hypothetical protein